MKQNCICHCKLNLDQGGFASFFLLCGMVNVDIYILNEYNMICRCFSRLSSLCVYLMAWNTNVIPTFLTVVVTILDFTPFIMGVEKEGSWFSLAVGTMRRLVMYVIGVFIFLPMLTLILLMLLENRAI